MKFTQRKNRHMTRLLLLAVLFAQGILAAHACVAPIDGALPPLSRSADVEAMSCHEEEKTDSTECLMHCTQPYQVNVDQHSMAAAAVDVAVLHVAMPQLQHQTYTFASVSLPLNTGPPLAIRFCSFRI